MNRTTAFKIDSLEGDFYVDEEKELNCWGVFGTETGFCYFINLTKEQCEEHCEEMRKNIGKC